MEPSATSADAPTPSIESLDNEVGCSFSERYHRRRYSSIFMTDSEYKLPSNRSFGALFIVFFGVIGGHQWWRGNVNGRWWIGAATILLITTLLKPSWLTPFNRAWMAFADVLHRLISPIALGVVYFGLFMPVGYAMRVFGRDVLHRRFAPASRSYWVERTPPGPDIDGLVDQF